MRPILYVYVAGPWTCQGNGVFVAMHRAVEVADRLWKLGYIPWVPHLHYLWEVMFPKPKEEWMEYDQAWIERCDALFRISGFCGSADKEVAYALSLGIPVFYDIASLVDFEAGMLQEKSSIASGRSDHEPMGRLGR